jgi:hypothetical protein
MKLSYEAKTLGKWELALSESIATLLDEVWELDSECMLTANWWGCSLQVVQQSTPIPRWRGLMTAF